MRGAPSDRMVAELEIELPANMAVGRGSAVVIAGHCYLPGARTGKLAIEIGGEGSPIPLAGLPRDDVYAGADGDPAAFKSGFAGIADISPRQRSQLAEVTAVIETTGGRVESRPLGAIRLVPELEPPAEHRPPAFSGEGPPVAICMATYNPSPELLRVQLDSIREQTHGNWVCVISDDASQPASVAAIREQIRGDERFALSPSPDRLGFYRNFERAMSMAPPEAEYATLCDQDDRWHPDKLERLLAAIGSAQLVYSDARVVRDNGDVLHDSYWTNRRNNHTNLASLLLANSVTGAASLFRRDLLDDVLPFPQQLDEPYHDHWLAVVALARGDIAYLADPLYDYVQHDAAVIGHEQANRRPRPVRRHLMERIRNPGDGSRVVYYYAWHQLLLFSEVLRLRCWDRMSIGKRRALSRVLSADRGAAGLAWLLGRRVRRLWGRNETLDRELYYAYALGRRRAVSLWTLGRTRPSRRLPRDASIPPASARGGA